MDGVFVTDGLIPTIDYEARQVGYVYVIGAFVKLLGHDFARLRLFPLLAWLGTAQLIYLIGVRLFSRRVGLVAAVLLLLTPFALFMAPMVKTEPLTAFLCTLGVYAVIRGVQAGPWAWWYAGAGAAFAAGFYVRQSALAASLAAIAYLLLVHHSRLARLASSIALVGLGYAAVCAVVIGYFSTHAPVDRVLAGPLNPLAFVTERIQRIRGESPSPASRLATPLQETQSGTDPIVRFERPYQSLADKLRFAFEVGGMLAPLIVGGACAMAWIAFVAGSREHLGPLVTNLGLFSMWSLILAAAYLHWATSTGVFFPAYAMEFVPPLSLLTAVVLVEAMRRLPEGAATRMLVASGVLAIPLVLLPWVTGHPSARSASAATTVLVLGISAFGVTRGESRDRWIRALVVGVVLIGIAGLISSFTASAVDIILAVLLLSLVLLLVFRAAQISPSEYPGTAVGFVAIAVIAAAGMHALAASTSTLSLRYDGVWSPQTMRDGAEYVRTHSVEGDVVLSGAVMWEMQAGRRPFDRISHPLAFMDGMRAQRARELQQTFDERPPRFVILDGYLERTYFRNMPELEKKVARDYDLRTTLTDSRRPVRIYERRSAGH